jgi:EpsI family protein
LFTPLWAICWQEWWREQGTYSHGILIPLLAGYMVWHRRNRFVELAPRPALSGLALVIPGLFLQLFGRFMHSTMVQWAAFLVLATGGLALCLGWVLTRRLLPCVLYLTFMVPMSAMLTQPLVFGAQKISTAVAGLILKVTGFHAEQIGTIIKLESYTFQVALPCSGFKTLIALSAFAACLVYLLDGPWGKKLFLFGAAMTLALIVNGLRIALVGITGELFSEEAATWVHDNGGLPVTALALGGLFLMARMLNCPLSPPSSGDQRPTTNDQRRNGDPGDGPRPHVQTLVVSVATFTALTLAVAVFAVRMPTVQSASRAPGQAPPDLPLVMGQWKGTVIPIPSDVQKALPTAQILSRRYECPIGVADVTIVSGSDATALHDPHDCLTGDGWEFLTERRRSIDVGRKDGPITIRDVVMAKDKVRARLWYWYNVGPEVHDRTLPARLRLFWTRMVERKQHRAEFVRLIVGGETETSRTELLLTDLARHCTGQ